MRRSTAPYGMLLDRGLTLEQLDLAYDIGVADPDPKTNRRKLTVALRDLVGDQEAEGKTKKCLTRVWLNPPPEAAEMITWARDQVVPRAARPVFHFGALLATFPFVGAVARVIGQHLQTEGRVEASVVRTEVRRSLGDRSSVDVAARKTYTTLRNLGLLHQRNQLLTCSAQRHQTPAEISGWLIHALLLTRQAESLPISSLQAPELLGVRIEPPSVLAYGQLRSHSTGSGAVLERTATDDSVSVRLRENVPVM